MTFEAIEQEIATWDEAQLTRLIHRAVEIRSVNNPERGVRLARLIDDKTPGRWLTLEEADKRLGITDGGRAQ